MPRVNIASLRYCKIILHVTSSETEIKQFLPLVGVEQRLLPEILDQIDPPTPSKTLTFS